MGTRATHSVRLGLCVMPHQEAVLRRAAEITDKSVADFILDSAYQAAEQTILDQNLFIGSESQFQEFLELLDRPAQDNPLLRDLFSRPVPWDG